MKNYLHKKAVAICMSAVLLITAAPAGKTVQAKPKAKINKTRVSLYVGGKSTLKIKGTKAKVKWSLRKADKKIISLKVSGKRKTTAKIKAKKAGKAVITAKTAAKKFRCRITVKKRKPTKPNRSETSGPPDTSITRTPAAPGISEPPAVSGIPAVTASPTERPDKTSEPAGTETPNTTPEPAGTETPNAPSLDTINYNAGEYSINTVHTGEGTYYDRESTGASNLDYLEASYFTVAMNTTDYLNGLAGAFLEITDKDGDSIQAFVTDRLPEGKKGDIDFSRKAFESIEPLVTGRMNISWKIIPFPTTEPISYLFKPTSSEYWAEVQIRNHRYPISKLEYLDQNSGQYVELARKEYNYFTADSGMGKGPYTFRITDFYGHVLVDTGITLNTTETPINGTANFPY